MRRGVLERRGARFECPIDWLVDIMHETVIIKGSMCVYIVMRES